MNAIVLLALTSILVLRSGDRIPVEGAVREENGVVVFRSAGKLYSLPATEVDSVATRAEAERTAAPKGEPVRRLRVSEEERRRLIAELEQNHTGTAPPAHQTALAPLPPEEPRNNGEEWTWRTRARAHEDAVRESKEELSLLETKVEKLRSEIRAFVSLGYKPGQFTWQATQLEYALQQIPRAQLEISRAERALVQFKEDARKQGVMPGWLR